MRIDWKTLEEGSLLPDRPDWSDPTHVPIMVAQVLIDLGNSADICLDDDQEVYLWGVAIDAMPEGEQHVRKELEREVRLIAVREGWDDWLYAPGKKNYPWEGEEE